MYCRCIRKEAKTAKPISFHEINIESAKLQTNLAKLLEILWLSPSPRFTAKGQLILKCPFGVTKLIKKNLKLCKEFCLRI